MALYAWKEEYSVGVPTFDNHHMRLFDIVNSLHEMMKEGKSGETVEKTLNDLVEYTAYHLAEEEKAMARINYSGIIEHKRAHKQFVDEINKVMEQMEKGQAIFVVVKVSNLVVDWLVKHILVVDKKYTEEMKAAGIT